MESEIRNLELLGRRLRGDEAVLKLVTRHSERAGDGMLLVLHHPGEEFDGGRKRTEAGRRAGEPDEAGRVRGSRARCRPPRSGAADREGASRSARAPSRAPRRARRCRWRCAPRRGTRQGSTRAWRRRPGRPRARRRGSPGPPTRACCRARGEPQPRSRPSPQPRRAAGREAAQRAAGAGSRAGGRRSPPFAPGPG